MPDYTTANKTDWFINKMRSGWFTRQEILGLAAAEFPSESRKRLVGTIGQYWTDCINPKFSTNKTICERGLTVVEEDGQRHIVDNVRASTPCQETEVNPVPHGIAESATRNAVKPQAPRKSLQTKPAEAVGLRVGARTLWNCCDPEVWKRALGRYWDFVKPSHLPLEREMFQLDARTVQQMDPQTWYKFLLEKYFRWKYTEERRYVTTTKFLKTYELYGELPVLHSVKERLFTSDLADMDSCLRTAASIRGLGPAGASGLLTVLFPAHFGTVDQFVVKALSGVLDLPEYDAVAAMEPESLTIKDGVVLIGIMRRKSEELNNEFSVTEWTPRKIDMILWTCGR